MNYQEMNWPALPDDINAALLEFCKTEPAENITNKVPPGEMQPFLQFNPPDYLLEWVKENIPISLEENVLKLQVWRAEGDRIVKGVWRHIDRKRAFSYNYLLMDFPSITRWFEGDTVVDSVRYEHKKWYMHNGGEKYHDVINVENFRAAVTIFKPIPFNDTPANK